MSALRVLCIHGVGDHHTNLSWEDDWKAAVKAAVAHWNPALELEFTFLVYDDIFSKYPLNPVTYAEALYKMGGSGVAVGAGVVVDRVGATVQGAENAVGGFVSGIGDLFRPSRGLAELPAELRWTAGMVAQWADSARLRAELRAAVTESLANFDADLVVAHSLGTLISYDTFSQDQRLLKGRTLVVFGSQVGNAFVRGLFGGYITPLTTAKAWYQLYNPNDRAFSAEIKVTADNFHEATTEFTDGFLNHDAVKYLSHPNALATVWQSVSTPELFAPVARAITAFKAATRQPKRRALLVGINEYPDPQNRLEGCVNDVFLMSAALQESGFDPEDIRVVFDDRATAAGMMDRLHWLLDGTRPNDERVFFYSGHGAQMPAYGVGGKVDRVIDCLVPYDFNWTLANAITDEQFVNLYSQLPFDSAFVCILDCCHSGGIVRAGGAKIRGITPPDDIRHRAIRWDSETQMWVQRDFHPAGSRARPVRKAAPQPQKLARPSATHPLGGGVNLRRLATAEQHKAKSATGHGGPFMPVVLEACQEDQLSYEYRHGVTSYGAFTFAMTKILSDARRTGKRPTFPQLKTLTEKRLRWLGYEQTPALRGPSKVLAQKIPWHPSGPVSAKSG